MNAGIPFARLIFSNDKLYWAGRAMANGMGADVD
jgi:hypothetical protein